MNDIDRELLELAAKAAGLNLTYCPAWGCMAKELQDSKGKYFDAKTCWRPLTDDGDSLRLAVKLRLGIEINQSSVIVCWVDGGYETKDVYEYPESVQDDNFDIVHVNHDKATRRAIVRAAAEIGRSM